MSIISIRSNRKSLYSVLLVFCGGLAGCTTIPPEELCTPTQQKQLNKQLLATQSIADRKEAELARLKKAAVHQHCVGSLFTPAAKSAQCTQLLAKTDRLTTETQTLRERIYELNMALAGRPSPSKQVKSCKATWVVPPKKFQSKTGHAPHRRSKPVAKPRAQMTSTIALPVYEIPAPAKVEKLDYSPSKVQTSNSPTYIAPVQTTPTGEHPYVANTKVRVVGPEFFQDQSTLASQPTPVLAPAP